jgi:cobalt-precorrin 5A hydrolase
MNDTLDPRVAMVAITKHGAKQIANLAPRIPEASVIVSEKFAATMKDVNNIVKPYSGPLRAQLPDLFKDYDQIIFCISLGAVVRLIAPHLKSKDEDPGVLVIDDAAQFVIPVLSGHVGGANAYAEQIANILGATAVLTTASDVGKTIAVDILGRELGWQVEAPKINITRVSAHVVNEESIAFVQESGSTKWWTRPTPLPANIHVFNSYQEVDKEKHKAVLLVTNREINNSLWQQWGEYMVVYRPPVEDLSQSGKKKVSERTIKSNLRVGMRSRCLTRDTTNRC